jgi:hypothetical protein
LIRGTISIEDAEKAQQLIDTLLALANAPDTDSAER